MSGALNWTQVGEGSRDLEAEGIGGRYTISFDSLSAGGNIYLWLPGQADDEDPAFISKFEAVVKITAQAHHGLSLQLSQPQGEET